VRVDRQTELAQGGLQVLLPGVLGGRLRRDTAGLSDHLVADVSWRDIADETDVNTGTARRVYERKERYLEETEAAVQ